MSYCMYVTLPMSNPRFLKSKQVNVCMQVLITFEPNHASVCIMIAIKILPKNYVSVYEKNVLQNSWYNHNSKSLFLLQTQIWPKSMQPLGLIFEGQL